jgi:subtilisin family serine protease
MRRELILVASPSVDLRDSLAISSSAPSATGISTILSLDGVTLRPLFGVSRDRIRRRFDTLSPSAPSQSIDPVRFFQAVAPDERLDELAEQFRSNPLISAAYVKPAGEPPVGLNNMQPLAAEAPAFTPDFTSRQGYLDAGPTGVDARYAWTLPGGGGAGVEIIDLEWAWQFSHEDLAGNQGGVVAGTPSGATDHGTAVLGVLSGDRNEFGVTGICPDASVSAVSFSDIASADAIILAADRLQAGDIILLEIHRPGPRFGFEERGDQHGYIPIEWWPDDLAAIQYAVGRGIIVVEAGGNGFENLNDSLYEKPDIGFPPEWVNPYGAAGPDSGAILVGAGAPPPETHGKDFGPNLTRLTFSNYGSRLDAQGWGKEVTTCGYGDLQGGADPNLYYSDKFAGTSSASPIVAGAIGCLQGVLHAESSAVLTPVEVRELLRTTGSLQAESPDKPLSERIGSRPDLRQLISALAGSGSVTNSFSRAGIQFRGVIPAADSRTWYTHEWPADWHVIWRVLPVDYGSQGPQVSWDVEIERTADRTLTYWITVRNLRNKVIEVEGHYVVLNAQSDGPAPH